LKAGSETVYRSFERGVKMPLAPQKIYHRVSALPNALQPGSRHGA
jgi:hypothetical protein